jgi:hypothetical protein
MTPDLTLRDDGRESRYQSYARDGAGLTDHVWELEELVGLIG